MSSKLAKGLTLMVAFVATGAPAAPAHADDLYRSGTTQSLTSDRRAGQAGDTLTVVIVQSAESSTTMQSGTRKSSSLTGHFTAGHIDEGANVSFGGGYDGQGQIRRSERFVTQMTASIVQVLPNGDYLIAGTQRMNINGEATTVEVRGRIRAADIDGENRVPSNRIADAQIGYNGKGFVSRGAKPGLIHKLLGLLGLN